MTKELYDLIERCEGRAGIMFTIKLRKAVVRSEAEEYRKGRNDGLYESSTNDRRQGEQR